MMLFTLGSTNSESKKNQPSRLRIVQQRFEAELSFIELVTPAMLCLWLSSQTELLKDPALQILLLLIKGELLFGSVKQVKLIKVH